MTDGGEADGRGRPEVDPLLGRTLGSFVICERLAEGGIGVLYRAEQLLLGREAAVKVLDVENSGEEADLHRFVREARLASRLSHSCAAHVYAFGWEPDGVLWIAMELVRGQSLHDLLQGQGPMAPAEFLPLFDQLCEVVDCAHRMGIVHRDIKPRNVMVLREGQRLMPKLLDFGLAKLKRAGGGAGAGARLVGASPPTPADTFDGETPLVGTLIDDDDGPARAPWRQLPRDGRRSPGPSRPSATPPWCTPSAMRGGATAGQAGPAPPGPLAARVPAARMLLSRAVTDLSVTLTAPPAQPRPEPISSAREVTLNRSALGSPLYMAPEQWSDAASVDGRADIYSLAVLAYEMLSGAPPFWGKNLADLEHAHHHQPVPPLGSPFPAEVDGVMLRALAKRPDERFATASELARALREALDLENVLRTSGRLRALGATAGAAPRTLAVWPFRNLGSSEHDYVADGLTEDLIDSLSAAPGLRVISRGAVMRLRDHLADVSRLGPELGVELLIDGSVRVVQQQVRVTARIISVDGGFQLWAKRIERPVDNLLAINDEVISATLDALAAENSPPPRVASRDGEAVDLYLRARHEYHRYTASSLQRAAALYERALARAPDDPMMLAGYALAGMRQLYLVHDIDVAVMETSLRAARRAAELAPEMPEPQLALATVLVQHCQFPAAIDRIKRALKRSPWVAEAHALRGQLLGELGATDEGLRDLHRALSLDPALSRVRWEMARTKALIGDWEGAVAAFETDQGPGEAFIARSIRARLILWRGSVSVGVELLREFAQQMHPAARYGLEALNGNDAFHLIAPLVSQAAARFPRRVTFFLQLGAEAKAWLGKNDDALEAIERAIDSGLINLCWLDLCPVLGTLQHLPRFIECRRRVAERASGLLAALRSQA